METGNNYTKENTQEDAANMKAFVFNLVDTHLTKYFRIQQSINRHQVLTVTTVHSHSNPLEVDTGITTVLQVRFYSDGQSRIELICQSPKLLLFACPCLLDKPGSKFLT